MSGKLLVPHVLDYKSYIGQGFGKEPWKPEYRKLQSTFSSCSNKDPIAEWYYNLETFFQAIFLHFPTYNLSFSFLSPSIKKNFRFLKIHFRGVSSGLEKDPPMSGNLQLRTRKFYKWNLVSQKHLPGGFNLKGFRVSPKFLSNLMAFQASSTLLSRCLWSSLVPWPRCPPVWPGGGDIWTIADWMPGFSFGGIHCLHSLCPTISLPTLGCIAHDWASTKFIIWASG